MFDNLKAAALIVDRKTVVVAGMAVGSMVLCEQFDWLAEFPLTLIATAIVFPIVFSIDGAYKRRETVLAEYGTLKAHGRALYFAVRDWMPAPEAESRAQAQVVLGDVMQACRTLFRQPTAEMDDHEAAVYASLSRLSRFIRTELRDKGLASGECSRANQYVSKMTIAFENLKHIYQYRTPQSLRAYSDLFIILLPVLYGPYFAYIGRDFSPGLEYLMPVLFAFILVGLDNIQEQLENPFDQIGVDDVAINAEKFVARLDD